MSKFYLRNIRKVVRDVKHRGLNIPWMEVEPRDCFIASWPRSGNTWLRHILYFYVTGRTELDMATLDAFCPILDGIDLKGHLSRMGTTERRFIKTHELGAPYFARAKIIYLVRDGRDATWSYHKYRLRLAPGTPEAFDVFLRQCLADRIRYRSWHRNVGTWLELRDAPTFLLLRFEELRADPGATFTRVLEHLGIDVDPERVKAAVALATPERVNETFRTIPMSKSRSGDGAGQGGVVERWRETYTPEQQALFEEKAGPVLKELDYATLSG